MIPWAVRYFRDKRGRLPVEFFELPSIIRSTKVERAKFYARLELLREHGSWADRAQLVRFGAV